MKKAGWSNSKSKILPTSKSTREEDSPPFGSLAVGHRPVVALSPQDEALFHAYQANLLSLISHELRTPLTGLLNALRTLESGEPAPPPLTPSDLVKMAKENAERLYQSLEALLDLAALEGGIFHARLGEVDFGRMIRARMESHTPALLRGRARWICEEEPSAPASPILADPQKLGRAIDLVFQLLLPRVQSETAVKVRISSNRMGVSLQLRKDQLEPLELAWTQALVGSQSGVASPYSAFSGVLQTEEAFLTRAEEGLGSELLLIHEIMRIHRGKLTATRDDTTVAICMELPQLSTEEELREVLAARADSISTALGSLALVLVAVPKSILKPPAKELESIRGTLQKSLARTTDAVYWLTERNFLAVVLDDCKLEEATRWMTSVNQNLSQALPFGIAHCPSDGLDSSKLFKLAEKRLSSSRKT